MPQVPNSGGPRRPMQKPKDDGGLLARVPAAIRPLFVGLVLVLALAVVWKASHSGGPANDPLPAAESSRLGQPGTPSTEPPTPRAPAAGYPAGQGPDVAPGGAEPPGGASSLAGGGQPR